MKKRKKHNTSWVYLQKKEEKVDFFLYFLSKKRRCFLFFFSQNKTISIKKWKKEKKHNTSWVYWKKNKEKVDFFIFFVTKRRCFLIFCSQKKRISIKKWKNEKNIIPPEFIGKQQRKSGFFLCFFYKKEDFDSKKWKKSLSFLQKSIFSVAHSWTNKNKSTFSLKNWFFFYFFSLFHKKKYFNKIKKIQNNIRNINKQCFAWSKSTFSYFFYNLKKHQSRRPQGFFIESIADYDKICWKKVSNFWSKNVKYFFWFLCSIIFLHECIMTYCEKTNL